MTTSLDAKILPKVLAGIQRIGVRITLYESDGTYSPGNGETTGGGTAHANVLASPPIDVELRMIDGDTLRAGDAVIYLAGQGLGFEPKVGWTVAAAGRSWDVVAVRDLRSGDLTAAWELVLRR